MARYTFTCEHFDYNDFNGDEQNVASKHTTQFRADELTTMLENFELFLRGSGFVFNGVIDVVKPESDNFENEEEPNTRVMDHIVADLLQQKETEELKKGICEVCKLPIDVMLRHSCFEDQCPLKTK